MGKFSYLGYSVIFKLKLIISKIKANNNGYINSKTNQ